MDKASNQIKRFQTVFASLTLAATLFIHACSSGSEATFVDFSKKIVEDQPSGELQDGSIIRVAVAAMISPKESVVYYHQLLDFIAKQLDHKIQLIQRKTYSEINKLLKSGKIDLAFICSGPYATGRQNYGFEALAVPQVRGKHFYHSYLIVNQNSGFQDLMELRGKTFAFTDPESNTGKLVPTYWLVQQKQIPKEFFGKIIYTHSHDNSIMAVATSLVDAAAVHEQIWQYFNSKDPTFTSNTRVIKKSQPFGNPPVVASKYLSSQLKADIRQLLMTMHQDPEGKRILDELMIDRFLQPEDKWYDSIVAMKHECTL
ncbi:MAG: phosphate/phosphite/phosphonate ABC transporter substrate-binding protein [Deltaproteobacteria bacterium]|nr:phosphate/phosphite/phosphonate ABC transporter substrate-binding protein [Deltaproteobacteria bacterium]MBT8359260.1 phosphate/phosphite/phosphonate ABC transporter substrate-binding protein [Deltaproteobacteria bacterium]MBT8373310.1 phosphate/phosphite/phosphonate ABC transporter substrate-binding protein [Deltaproteobacteria bacterium]NNK85693.1 phosphate/phosphite/phosphonate ABC transporter substrate-binding protein [Desulfobacterales bacterium]NNL74860.1 phosphate/phosphite/phosphonat